MMEKSKLVKVEKVKKNRIWEIDFLRGLSIFLMIIDHAFIALSEFGDAWFTAGQMRVSAEIQAYGLIEMIRAMSSGELLGGASFALRLCYFSEWWWLYCGFRKVAQPLFASIFIVICGISCTLSHNNLKRGLLLLLVAEALTLGTHLYTKPDVLNFGVLHLLAVCILVFEGINAIFKGDKKSIAAVTASLSAVLLTVFLILRHSQSFAESYGPDTGLFKNVLFCTKHSAHYAPGKIYNNALSFSPIDFFPILPWMAVFMFGAAFGKIFYEKKTSLLPKLDGKWNKPLLFMGRYTIWFYLGEPVVVYGILMLVSYFKMSPGNWVLF